MTSIGIDKAPWVEGSSIAHQEFAIRWDDSVPASDPPHAGHSDRIVFVDDADRPVLEGWATAAAKPDGGSVEMKYTITAPGLREGLYTAKIEVDADDKVPSATAEVLVPVTFDGAGVAKPGQSYKLSFKEVLVLDTHEYSAANLAAETPFRLAVGVQNEGPDPAPSNRKCSVHIAGSGGSFEDEGILDSEITVGSTVLLTFLVSPGLASGVYRAEIWADLITTIEPISTTYDFTVP